MSRCARSLPLAAMVVALCAGTLCRRCAAGHRWAGCALALRPRAQGLRRHRAQHDARRSGSRSPTACSATSTSRPTTTPTSRRCSTSSPTARAFTDLQTRDTTYTVKQTDDRALTCRVTATAKSGRYKIVTDYIDRPDAPDRRSSARGSSRCRAAARLPPLRPLRPDAQRQRRRRDRATAAPTTAPWRRPAATRCSSARTPSPQTNAANRDYAVPVYSRARRRPRLRPGVQRLRGRRQRRPQAARRRATR